LNPVQQISKPNIDFQNVKDKILSINLRINGLSFVILEANNIIKAEYYEWQTKDWNYATIQFKEVFDRHDFFKKDFKKTFIIIKSKECTLIPKSLFDKTKTVNILEALFNFDKNEFLPYHLNLKKVDIVLAFALNVNLDNLINKTFPKATIIHQSVLFIDESLDNTINKNRLYLDISNQSFEVIGIKNDKIIAHNHFEYTSVDEFMFFLLSFVKQNNLSLNTLHISGMIAMESKIGKNLEKYFQHIEHLSKSAANEKELIFEELKKYTLIANS
jgi:hypothetical protein